MVFAEFVYKKNNTSFRSNMVCIDAETVKLIKSHFDISRIFPIDNIVLLTSEMPSMDQPKIPHMILLILKHDNILCRSRITAIKTLFIICRICLSQNSTSFISHKVFLGCSLYNWYFCWHIPWVTLTVPYVSGNFESTELAPHICPHDNFCLKASITHIK